RVGHSLEASFSAIIRRHRPAQLLENLPAGVDDSGGDFSSADIYADDETLLVTALRHDGLALRKELGRTTRRHAPPPPGICSPEEALRTAVLRDIYPSRGRYA